MPLLVHHDDVWSVHVEDRLYRWPVDVWVVVCGIIQVMLAYDMSIILSLPTRSLVGGGRGVTHLTFDCQHGDILMGMSVVHVRSDVWV